MSVAPPESPELSVAERFAAVRQRIEPGDDVQLAIERHAIVREVLLAQDLVVDTFLTGSCARNTAIKPLHNVEMFAVFEPRGDEHDALSEARDLINQFCNVLKRDLPDRLPIEEVNLQGRSVSILFTDTSLSINVVPSFADGDTYKIPDRALGGWIASNPKAAKAATEEANERSGGRLVPLIKLAKRWNQFAGERSRFYKNDQEQVQHFPEGQEVPQGWRLVKPFKSFHLEVLSVTFFKAAPAESERRNFAILLMALYQNFMLNIAPPGMAGQSLNAYLMGAAGQPKHPFPASDINRLVMEATKVANDAWFDEKTNPTEAHRCWRSLLGDVY